MWGKSLDLSEQASVASSGKGVAVASHGGWVWDSVSVKVCSLCCVPEARTERVKDSAAVVRVGFGGGLIQDAVSLLRGIVTSKGKNIPVLE